MVVSPAYIVNIRSLIIDIESITYNSKYKNLPQQTTATLSTRMERNGRSIYSNTDVESDSSPVIMSHRHLETIHEGATEQRPRQVRDHVKITFLIRNNFDIIYIL